MLRHIVISLKLRFNMIKWPWHVLVLEFLQSFLLIVTKSHLIFSPPTLELVDPVQDLTFKTTVQWLSPKSTHVNPCFSPPQKTHLWHRWGLYHRKHRHQLKGSNRELQSKATLVLCRGVQGEKQHKFISRPNASSFVPDRSTLTFTNIYLSIILTHIPVTHATPTIYSHDLVYPSPY